MESVLCIICLLCAILTIANAAPTSQGDDLSTKRFIEVLRGLQTIPKKDQEESNHNSVTPLIEPVSQQTHYHHDGPQIPNIKMAAYLQNLINEGLIAKANPIPRCPPDVWICKEAPTWSRFEHLMQSLSFLYTKLNDEGAISNECPMGIWVCNDPTIYSVLLTVIQYYIEQVENGSIDPLCPPGMWTCDGLPDVQLY